MKAKLPFNRESGIIVQIRVHIKIYYNSLIISINSITQFIKLCIMTHLFLMTHRIQVQVGVENLKNNVRKIYLKFTDYVAKNFIFWLR